MQTEVAAAKDLTELSDIDRLQLQNLVLQHQALRAQLNVLIVEFRHTPQPRALQDRIDDLSARINSTTEKLFATYGIDPKSHQVDVERGAFVSRASSE